MKFVILRYAYDTQKKAPDDITINPTAMTTDNEVDAIQICELLQKAYDLGNMRTHHSWYKFGYEEDEEE